MVGGGPPGHHSSLTRPARPDPDPSPRHPTVWPVWLAECHASVGATHEAGPGAGDTEKENATVGNS